VLKIGNVRARLSRNFTHRAKKTRRFRLYVGKLRVFFYAESRKRCPKLDFSAYAQVKQGNYRSLSVSERRDENIPALVR